MPLPRIISIHLLAVIGLCIFAMGCGKSAPEEDTPAPKTTPVSVTETIPAETVLEVPPVPDSTPVDAPAPAESATTEWLIVPGERVGKITSASTEADIIAAYGAEHVRDDEFHVGEGEMVPCTAVFPEEDAKRIMVLWEDADTKTKPMAVSVDGVGSVWKTASGLGVGTPLTVVEELNGKPFMLYGFGWDYGGRVSDFAGGVLGTPEGALQVEFQLNYESDPPPADDLVNQVSGDAEFSSSNPVMHQLNPTVYSVVVGLGG